MTLPPILQVEDDENDILLLRYAFDMAGLQNELHAAKDGQEGIDYLAGTGAFADRSRFPLPCLVLLDLKSPRKDGMEVLRWIRAQPGLRRLVVIMFTASRSQRDIELAYEYGANAFLVKPTGVEPLLDLVRAIDAFWLSHNQFSSTCLPEE